MCALIYQLVWTRWLGLQLGTFATATATVVTTFMAGLAIGNAALGRLAARRTPAAALLFYAYLEAGLALFAALSPALFASSSPLYPVLARASGNPLLRALICFSLILPPTILMGGTLPALVQTLTATAPRALGPLYALNTLGGALGPLLAAFVLMPGVGFIATILLAATLNAAVAFAAFLIARRWKASEAPPAQAAPVPAPAPAGSPFMPYMLAALSGLIALGFEIALTRLIILTITGGSVYGFAMILSAFLLGLALGAWLLRIWPPPDPAAALKAFALAQGLIWLFSLATPFWDMLPPLLVRIWWQKPEFGMLSLLNFGTVFLLLLLLTTASGYALPALAAGLRRARSDTIGALFAANTLGAVVGSAATGFFLLLYLGLDNTLLVLGALGLLASLLALAAAYLPRAPVPVQALGAAGLAALTLGASYKLLPSPDIAVLNAGMYNRPHGFLPGAQHGNATPQEAAHRLGRIVYQKDSLTGRIVIRAISPMRMAFVVNGKPDGSTSLVDMYTQIMMAHLPAMMHPDPKRVLVIGLGTGTTTGCLTLHKGIREIHVAEIEPAQIDVARFFQQHNYGAVDNSRVRVHLDDARHYLMTDTSRYDIIVSEPSNLYVSGMVNLFTKEFYETVREHLSPGGAFFQWIHYYRVRPEDVRGMLKTFTEVFPQTTFWIHEFGDAFMMASDRDFRIDLADWEKRLAEPVLAKDLERIKIAPPLRVMQFFLWGPDDIRRYAEGGRICTDDDPYLEFTTPRQIYAPEIVATMRLKMQSFSPIDPVPLIGETAAQRIFLGDIFYSSGNVNRARCEYARALALEPSSRKAKEKMLRLESLLSSPVRNPALTATERPRL